MALLLLVFSDGATREEYEREWFVEPELDRGQDQGEDTRKSGWRRRLQGTSPTLSIEDISMATTGTNAPDIHGQTGT